MQLHLYLRLYLRTLRECLPRSITRSQHRPRCDDAGGVRTRASCPLPRPCCLPRSSSSDAACSERASATTASCRKASQACSLAGLLLGGLLIDPGAGLQSVDSACLESLGNVEILMMEPL